MLNVSDLSSVFSLISTSSSSILRKIRFGKKKQIAFLQDLERLTRTINLAGAISHLISASKGVELEILMEMQERSRAGLQAVGAAPKWFNPEVAAALVLNEGDYINRGLNLAIEILKSPSANILGSFKIIIYPMFLLAIAFGMNKFIYQFFLEKERKRILESDAFPPEFASVIHVADFIGFPLIMTLIFLFLAIVAFYFFFTEFVGDLRNTLDKLPIFNVYRNVCSIMFLRMFSNLLFLNMPNIKAIEHIDSNTNSTYLKYHLSSMATTVANGGSIGLALDTGLLNSFDVATIKILAKGKGDAYKEAIDGALEMSIARLQSTLRIYSVCIAASIALLAINLALNGVTTVMSTDLLFQDIR